MCSDPPRIGTSKLRAKRSHSPSRSAGSPQTIARYSERCEEVVVDVGIVVAVAFVFWTLYDTWKRRLKVLEEFESVHSSNRRQLYVSMRAVDRTHSFDDGEFRLLNKKNTYKKKGSRRTEAFYAGSSIGHMPESPMLRKKLV